MTNRRASDELRDVQLENAKAHQRFWEGLRRVHTDTIEGDEGVIGAAERAIANSEASAANAAVHAKAKRNWLSESSAARQVQSGLGKSLTRKEAEAIMMQAE